MKEAKTVGKFIIGAFVAPIAAIIVILSFILAVITGIFIALLTALLVAVGACVGFVLSMINDENVARAVVKDAKLSLIGFAKQLCKFFRQFID